MLRNKDQSQNELKKDHMRQSFRFYMLKALNNHLKSKLFYLFLSFFHLLISKMFLLDEIFLRFLRFQFLVLDL